MVPIAKENKQLRRLLKRQASPLLERLATMLPGYGLALLEFDGEVVAQAGDWPAAAIEALQAQVADAGSITALNEISAPEAGALRVHPLIHESEPIGLFAVHREGDGARTEAGEPFIRILELFVAQAIEKRELIADTLNRYREINLLYRVSETIGAAMNPAVIHELVLEESKRVLESAEGADAGLFVVRTSLASGRETWDIKASFGDAPYIRTLKQLLHQKLKRLVMTERPEIITDLPRNIADVEYEAILWVPLKTPKRLLGGILLGRAMGKPMFTANDLKLLAILAAQSALALDNAYLFTQTDEELARRVEELDAFAHTVAHDLKSPLAMTITAADLLKDAWTSMEPNQIQELLQGISDNGHRLNNIIEELMLLSSVRSGEIVPEPLDMGKIIAESWQRLAYLVQQYRPEIICPTTWPVAFGYGPWVTEVWTNYLSNAMKYGGKPPRLELGAEEQKDGMARFWVKDNGPGLEPEDQAKLFTPFTQLKQARALGHGLGLSIVRRIIERLGGSVGVQSAPGQGSTFFFTLPMYLTEPSGLSDDRVRRAERAVAIVGEETD